MKQRLGIQFAINLAISRGGKCLSTEYENAHKKIQWRCSCGYEWFANLWSIRQGSWCPICGEIKRANNKRLDISVAKELAKSKNGECLSDVYIDAHSDLIWKCSFDHIWKAEYNNVKNGTWCRICFLKQCCNSFAKGYFKKHWKTGEKLFCRGSWEGIVIDYFNKSKIDFDWQIPFNMPNGRVYIVDLYNKVNNLYVEIKGYMRDHNRIKWEWFHKEYPNSELWNEKKLKEMDLL